MDSPSGLPVTHEERGHRGAFVIDRGGARLAEMTYSRAGAELVIIDHTEVSEALRGQGAGKKLVVAAVEWARESGVKLLPLCPFARSVFERHPELHDVLAPP